MATPALPIVRGGVHILAIEEHDTPRGDQYQAVCSCGDMEPHGATYWEARAAANRHKSAAVRAARLASRRVPA